MADKKPAAPAASEVRTGMSSRMRAKIEREMAQQEAERKRENLRKRLDVARMGVDSLVKEAFGEATKSFLTYLRLLELSKRVEPKRLHPSLFDTKQELPELVLLTGIYWDLARTFDRMKSNKRQKEHLHYLEQFVVFAKSASFKPLCAETLRKYLAADKAVHRSDFKAAYKQLGGNTCFIVSSLLDLTDPEVLPILSRFRDETLQSHSWGRWAVRHYEASAPGVARVLDGSPGWVRSIVAQAIDLLAKGIRRFT
jgi:hypothetical protein